MWRVKDLYRDAYHGKGKAKRVYVLNTGEVERNGREWHRT